MNYQAALDYVLSFADYERIPRSALVFDLRRIEMLLERLSNPQKAAKAIHIAGTKGKGSTAAMIASILTRAGYRTGLYTSPHLLNQDLRYRYRRSRVFQLMLTKQRKHEVTFTSITIITSTSTTTITTITTTITTITSTSLP